MKNNSCARKGGKMMDDFQAIHKLPHGDSPYVRAKYAQLVDKDPDAAIVLFWKAINAGDRVDSALKDMAVVMKQQDRAEEAIEAIKSFRGRCSRQAQESLDNVLIDLYKKCGQLDEQIQLLKQKLQMIYQGEAFNGKPTKTARSHGKKFQVTIKQETTRILGNLGWAYMQQMKYAAAEIVYRKAQEIDPDANKACNLCLCLIKQGKYKEARYVLDGVLQGKLSGSDDPKSFDLSLISMVEALVDKE
nr:protein SULFUR DEFICIENCY-INDUCED 1-like [Ipomoea batatas]